MQHNIIIHTYYYHGIKPINSYDAVKKIKYLQKNSKQNMMTEAFEIYNN